MFFPFSLAATSSFGLRHLPADYVSRSSDVEEVKRLLNSGQTSVGVVGTRGKNVVGVKGMGGLGKTVLAQAVCWDLCKTRQVIWLNVGQMPQLLPLLNTLASAISGKKVSFSDKVQAQDWIQENTGDKDSLVVLDDVWDVEHASTFDVLSGNCQLLITTRNSEVVHGLRGSQLHTLGALSKEQARLLLAKTANQDLNRSPREIQLLAEQILEECGGLPLAIALIGSSLVDAKNEQTWKDRLEALQDADLEEIRSCFPEGSYPYKNLMAAIDVSFNALPEEYRKWYLDLAVFGEDTEIPSHVLEMMWSDASGVHSAKQQRKLKRRVRDALAYLEKRSLVQNGATEGSYLVHDILHDYLQGKIEKERGEGALEHAHSSLLEKYRNRCHNGKWSRGPKGDAYFFKNLAHHLCAAACTSELVDELSNFDWLQNKLEETDLAFLLSDFTHVIDKDEQLELIRAALVLSSNVISRSKNQLGPQILGRLRGISEFHRVVSLMEQIRGRRVGRVSLVPINPCLTPPGGPLIRTTDSRSRTVVAIVVTPDRKKIITGSSDASIKVWDFKSGKELMTVSSHTKVVYSLALSQNGALLISGSFDSTIKVWDVDTMEEKRTLRGHNDLVNGVIISPDNQHIVSCSNDATVRIWDTGQGKLLHTLAGHQGHVRGIAMTSDGRRVISGSQDCTVKLWDVKIVQEERAFHGHSDTVYAVCFTPDESCVISGSGDQVIKIWDLCSGEVIRSLVGHTSEIYSVAMTPDGVKLLSTSDDRTVRVWDFSSGEELYALKGHSESVRIVIVTAEGDVAISGSEDYTYKVWDLKCTHIPAPFSGHQRGINAMAVSQDGTMAITASDDHLLKTWNCQCAEEIVSLKGHTSAVQAVTLHPTKTLAASGASDGEVKIWDLTTRQELLSFLAHKYPVQVLKYSHNGDILMSASQDNTIVLCDWKNGLSVHRIETPIYNINDLIIKEDNIIACSAGNRACKVGIEARGSSCMSFSGPDSRPYPAVVFSDGSKIVSGSSQGSYIRCWEVDSGIEVRHPCGHPRDSVITAVGVSSDHRYILSCSNQGTITRLELQSGRHEQLGSYKATQDEVTITGIAFLPPEDFVTGDTMGVVRVWSMCKYSSTTLFSCEAQMTVLQVLCGHLVTVADDQGRLHLIDCKNGDGVVSITAHTDTVNAIAVGSQGNLMASGSDDGSIKVWKVSPSHKRVTLELHRDVDNAHQHGVTALAFTGDSLSLVSGSYGNEVIQWDLEKGCKVGTFHSSSFGVNCVSCVGQRVYACFHDCTAAVWSLTEGKCLKTVVGRGGRFHVSRVLQEDGCIFSDGYQYTVKCWRLPSSKLCKEVVANVTTFSGHTDEVTSLCLLPGGKHLITGSRDKTLRLCDMKDGVAVSEFYFEQGIKALACGDDGLIAAGLSNGQLCFMAAHC